MASRPSTSDEKANSIPPSDTVGDSKPNSTTTKSRRFGLFRKDKTQDAEEYSEKTKQVDEAIPVPGEDATVPPIGFFQLWRCVPLLFLLVSAHRVLTNWTAGLPPRQK